MPKRNPIRLRDGEFVSTGQRAMKPICGDDYAFANVESTNPPMPSKRTDRVHIFLPARMP